MGRRAGLHGGSDLPAHEVGGGGLHHRPQRGLGVERVAQDIAAGQLDEALHEGPVEALVHVDPLDAAARLAGIEEGAVDGVLHGKAEENTVDRSEEHTSELQSLMRISYAVFCLKKQKDNLS